MGVTFRMLKWLINVVTKGHSKGSLIQDYTIAGDLDIVLAGNITSDERLFFEAIFLDICDRTQKHPTMNFEIKKGRIIWKIDPEFSKEFYISSKWFHSKVDLHDEYKTRLEKSKNLYLENEINFLEYYIIRTEIYSLLQIHDHEQFFQDVNQDEYFTKLKKKLSMTLLSNVKRMRNESK